MKLDLKFEQNQLNISMPFTESAGKFNANFGETSVIHGGQNGATFYPDVSADGIISWTNDRELPNPNPVNIKGDKGDTGANGKDGADGYTPIKGKDYFTETDKAEIVSSVIAALPVYDGSVTTV